MAIVMAVMTCGSAIAGDDKKVTVVGTVIEPNPEAANGAPGVRPSEGVQVIILGTNMSTVTDMRGAFHFENVKPGEVTFIASKAGFPSAVKRASFRGKMGNVLIYLTPDPATRTPLTPDCVYVSFDTPIEKEDVKVVKPQNGDEEGAHELSKPKGVKGAILIGTDPLTLGAKPFPIPAGPNDFQTNISAAANSIMVMDPNQPTNVNYVEIPKRLFWLAFNDTGNRLYGASEEEYINVYDTTKNNVVLSRMPTNGVVNDLVRVNRFIYAAILRNSGDGVMIIDPHKDGPARLILTPAMVDGRPAHPWSVTATNDGSKIYVAVGNDGGGQVQALDVESGKVLGAANVSANPLGIAITPDNRFLLVTCPKTASVAVIDATSMLQVAQVPVGIAPFRIAVRPDGTKAYVTCRDSNEVSVINLTSMTQGAQIAVGVNPLGIAISADGARIYVANQGSGTVSIIDGNKDIVQKATTTQPRSRPYGVAIKP